MTWQPTWFEAARKMADRNGWVLSDQPDGRLAFASADGARSESIISTGNDVDALRAINDAAAAMRAGAPAPVDPTSGLSAALKQQTARISAAVPIAKAIVEGRKAMALSDKMALLAERMQSVPKALEARADALLPRLDALEAKAPATFDALAAVVADAEKGVAAAEAAMRLLTNGGPLLDSGGSASGA